MKIIPLGNPVKRLLGKQGMRFQERKTIPFPKPQEPPTLEIPIGNLSEKCPFYQPDRKCYDSANPLCEDCKQDQN